MSGLIDKLAGRAGRVAAAVLLTLGVAVLYAVAGNLPFFQTLEAQTLSWRFHLRGPVEPGRDVALVMIDDRTINALGQWPLSRTYLARAVDMLAEDQAKVIALDLLFTGPGQMSSPEIDAALRAAEPDQGGKAKDPFQGREPDRVLANAISNAGNVIVPFAFAFQPSQANVVALPDAIARAAYRVYRLPSGADAPLPVAPFGVVAPWPMIAEAAATAHVSVVLEQDGGLRYDHPVIGYRETFYPSLPIETARLFLGLSKEDVVVRFGQGLSLADRTLPTDGQMRLLVNHYGPTATIETHSFLDLIEGRVPDGTFRDRIAVIGGTALGVGDTFITPYSRTLPGAEYHATVINNILHGDFLIRRDWTAMLDVAAIVVAGLLTALLTSARAPLLAGAMAAILLISWGTIATAAFIWGNTWLNFLFPAGAVVVVFAWFAMTGAVYEQGLRRRAERHRRNLSRYVPTTVAATLADRDQPFQSDSTQDAAVMFIDMIGFPRLSETISPADGMTLLREFHSRVETAVSAHNGTLDKFMGDGAMATFGVPEPRATDCRDAVACACDLARSIAAWRGELTAAGHPPVRVGIGLHHGPVLVGELGGKRQVQFTVTGDTVNVASRIEALTREHRATVLASDAVIQTALAAGDDDAAEGFVWLTNQRIRGRDQTVGLWGWRDGSEDDGDRASAPTASSL